MSLLDNSLEMSIKGPAVDIPQPQCCGGEITLYPNGDNCTPPPPYNSSYHPMPSFVPRPFPPPSLANIPVEYIIDQLHNLAPHYWNNTETTDCTIIVPVPHPQGRSMRAPETPPFPLETLPPVSSNHDPAGLGRRVTEPIMRVTPRITLQLHTDYLSAQSTFLRGLFSGASPLDLINSTSTCPPTFNTPSRTPSGQFTVPPDRLPRLLPGSASHPVVYLPLPDPTSIHLLIHWIYFGRTNFIENCLDRGVVQWEGIARNVEYLGLSNEIKVFLGIWYRNWLHPARARDDWCSSDEDSDTSDNDDDGGDKGRESFSATSHIDQAGDSDEEQPQRGRTRTTCHLSSHRHRSV